MSSSELDNSSDEEFHLDSDELDNTSEYSTDIDSIDELESNEIIDVNVPSEFDDMPWTSGGTPRPYFPFTANSGVQINGLNTGILSIFESFIDDVLIEVIVRETNRYAKQFIQKNSENIKEHSRVKKWSDTDPAEIKTLLGILILQGVCPKPEYKMYFSRRESIETPFFGRILSERRFHLLLKFLHFVDNETINENMNCRKLAKILPFLDDLKKKFMSIYIPEKNISIDESLIGWKGRLGWKQYIPSKRKRFGIKIFALCESSSGYMYNYIIYTGADTNYGPNYADEPITSRIVLSLTDPLLNKGYCLFLDNYYTSVQLVDKLVKKRTDCVGTMRANRKGIPNEIKKKLNKGETIARYRRKIMVQKWRDKKDIVMISSIHDESMTKITTKKREIEKPSCVVTYNENMGGVDLADNYLHFYGTARNRIKKYYMKIFFHFLSITALNSYQVYKKNGGKLKRIKFLLELGEGLVEKYGKPTNRSIRRSRTPNPSRLIERHFPSIIPPTTKEKPTKRCILCAENGKRKESRYWCKECHTGLCPAPCFGLYHTKE